MPDEADLNPNGLDWRELVGTYVLVGLTIRDARGDLVEQRQVHGRIVSADARAGLMIALEGERAGESYALPPDLRSFTPAPPGEYRLTSTGEVVCDPDYLTSWIVDRPEE